MNQIDTLHRRYCQRNKKKRNHIIQRTHNTEALRNIIQYTKYKRHQKMH